MAKIFQVLLDKAGLDLSWRLTHQATPHVLKAPYLKFFNYAYLHNASESRELDAENLHKRKELWDAVDLLVGFELTTYYKDAGVGLSDAQIDFAFEALFPWLDTLISRFFDGEQYPQSRDVLLRAATHINGFTSKLCTDSFGEFPSSESSLIAQRKSIRSR